MKRQTLNSLNKTTGFTLVELMVAVVISGVMASVALSHLWSSREYSTKQEVVLIVEENARYALDALKAQLINAGYKSESSTFTLAEVNGFFYTGQCDLIDNCTSNGVAQVSDRISMWLRPEAGDRIACNGVDLTAISSPIQDDESVIHSYYIDIDLTTGMNNLYCETFIVNSSGDSVRDFINNSNAIIEGIEQLQFQYGIFDPEISTTPTQYVSADNVTNWATVSSLKIAILVGSSIEDGFGERGVQSFQLLDAETYTPVDGDYCFDHLCKTFSTTVYLANTGDDF